MPERKPRRRFVVLRSSVVYSARTLAPAAREAHASERRHGSWFFAPGRRAPAEPFSHGFADRASARSAAKDWEEQKLPAERLALLLSQAERAKLAPAPRVRDPFAEEVRTFVRESLERAQRRRTAPAPATAEPELHVTLERARRHQREALEALRRVDWNRPPLELVDHTAKAIAHLELLGEELQLAIRLDPPAWVKDPAIWLEAEERVRPRWDSYDDPWAVVTTVYKRMGGRHT